LSEEKIEEDDWFSGSKPPAVERSQLLRFLTTFCDLELEVSRIGGLYGAVVLKNNRGERVILMERLYRDGVAWIEHPTEEDLTQAREANDLQEVWNSPRSFFMHALV
jgi:hypothetical protein